MKPELSEFDSTAFKRKADKYWEPTYCCPWCKCSSTDQDDCSECGAPMDGSDYYECPYCGETGFDHEGATCCKENHVVKVTLTEGASNAHQR